MAYKLLEMAQARWRGLDGAHLLPLVRAEITFVDGVQQAILVAVRTPGLRDRSRFRSAADPALCSYSSRRPAVGVLSESVLRIVFALAPGHGHLYPTLPLATAFRAAGHAVCYAMTDVPVFRTCVEASGFEFATLPPSVERQRSIIAAGLRDDPTLAGIFGPLAVQQVDPLLALCRSWQASAIIHDLATFAAPLAATLAGIPSVHHGIGPSFPDDSRAAGGRLGGLWRARGRKPDAYAGMFAGLYLDICPSALANPMAEHVPGRRPLQPIELGATNAPLSAGLPKPPWILGDAGDRVQRSAGDMAHGARRASGNRFARNRDARTWGGSAGRATWQRDGPRVHPGCDARAGCRGGCMSRRRWHGHGRASPRRAAGHRPAGRRSVLQRAGVRGGRRRDRTGPQWRDSGGCGGRHASRTHAADVSSGRRSEPRRDTRHAVAGGGRTLARA